MLVNEGKSKNHQDNYNQEIKHLYLCFIAVIKHGYEFGCI